ncbi:MAG TPA: DNA-binding protein [Burkholderiales bacterium]|jgi:predicted transcriptional regulator
MPKTLYVRVSSGANPGDDALDRFEAAWHLASGRAAPAPLAVLSFADLPLLMKNLTPARWDLLKRLKVAGPATIFALAKLLERDYKNVHTDVSRLLELNLLEKAQDGKVSVSWQAVRAELRLSA